MTKSSFGYFDILAAKAAYAAGSNVTEFLRRQVGSAVNDSDIIETAYDLQAGIYIDLVQKNPKKAALYAAEISTLLDEYLSPATSLLDVGAGELTTLSMVSQRLRNKPEHIIAFDVSWSRIYRGLEFAKSVMPQAASQLTAFVGDISEIALLDKSVSVTTSAHALEPNGGRLEQLLTEMFRITIERLVLFEPCYEINSDEGKRRMDHLGYIKDIDGCVERLGGTIERKVPLKNIANPLNPTMCFVIAPPKEPVRSLRNDRQAIRFSVPGTNKPLARVDDFYFSAETGLCFPVLRSIPILRSKNAILASSL